jgi:hypothetical protein
MAENYSVMESAELEADDHGLWVALIVMHANTAIP